MRTIIATVSFVSLLVLIGVHSTPARATSDEIKTAAHSQIMSVSRWGMCLLETMDEKTVRGVMIALGAKLDGKFEKTHGVLATNVAREIYGDDYLKVYYNLAKKEHDGLPANHAADCKRYSEIVYGLAR